MALASQSLVSEWLRAKNILAKKCGTRTKRDIDTIVPWLRNRGEIFTSLSEGAQVYLIVRTNSCIYFLSSVRSAIVYLNLKVNTVKI